MLLSCPKGQYKWDGKMITYEKPELEIIEFDNDDILLSMNSLDQGSGEGSGDSVMFSKFGVSDM